MIGATDDPIGNVGHGWDSIRLKYLCDINPDSVTGKFDEDDHIEYVEISSVNSRGQIEDTTSVQFSNAPSRAKRIVKDGDIIVSTVRTYLKAIALIEDPPENMVVSSGFAVLRPNEQVTSEYLWHVLQSNPFVDWIVANSEGVSYPAISTNKLSDLRVPVPPKQKQKQFCEQIDSQTTPIDELILVANDAVTQLKKKIQRVTKRTVLGRTHFSGQFSGVDVGWIGKVPEHWDVVRTRFVARLESGHTPSRSNEEYWENTDIPWVTTSDIKPFREGRKIYLHETEHQISELGLKNSGARLLPKGTVFLSRTASVGFSGIMGREMATSQDFANWVCGDEIIPEYLLYVFRSMDQEFDRLMQGSTHQTIYMPDIRSFKTPLPPVEEQREIVQHIQTERNRLWKLIDKVDQMMDLLEEKRQSLITGAVTGQIDVTEEQDTDQEVPA